MTSSPTTELPTEELTDDLERDLRHVAHLLPSQGPIEVFIHHNTLHAYQALSFHEALARARADLGASVYLEEGEYRAAYARGRIGPRELDWALDRFGPWEATTNVPVDPRSLLRGMLFGTRAPMSRDVLDLLKAEGRWADALDPGLDPSIRATLVSETATWLDEALRTGGLRAFARRLVGPRVTAVAATLEVQGASPERAEQEALRRVLHPLGIEVSLNGAMNGLRHRAEALTAFSLWGTCVELNGGADALAPAPFDPEHLRVRRLVEEALVPFLAGFLDRGVARWPPHGRADGFFDTWRRMHLRSGLPRPHWLDGLPRVLAASVDRGETAVDVLRAVPAERRRATLASHALDLPGWAGMFRHLERFPVAELPNVRLADYLAVRVLLEPFAREEAARFVRGLVEVRPILVDEAVLVLYAGAQRMGLSPRVLGELEPAARAGLLRTARRFDRIARSVVWQEAYERRHAVEVIGALRARPPVARAGGSVRAQVIFCIDDREESFRRHLEEVVPEIETFGAAGFFGVAIEFLGLDDVAAAPLAPLGLRPEHHVAEAPHPEERERARARRRWIGWWGRAAAMWRRTTRGVAGGSLAAFLMGPIALLELAARILAPRAMARLESALLQAVLPEVRTVLEEDRLDDETRSVEGRSIGFSAEEKADRVATTLENLGLTSGFAPIVMVVAHGSTSVNNPHRSAYDCGACGGRNGGPNGRLFARMANRPEVRSVLRRRGIVIPDTTLFVGAVHDTAKDFVRLYDEEDVPAAFDADLAALRAALEETCRRSAHERCRKLASAPARATAEAAHRHVEARAADPSEPRPELGHATNAVCVVGRRTLTRSLFLDRRAFLVSYDCSFDASGFILERVLAAVGPVGAGINLEYYFSRVDQERFGSGTKLPHNLTGHVGVMNGALSDLRTGLPRQMVELHEPMRLLLVVEAETETLLRVIARQPSVRQLVENDWVRLVTVSPSERGWFSFEGGSFEPWREPVPRLPAVGSSRAWYEGHDGFRPPAFVHAEVPGHGA